MARTLRDPWLWRVPLYLAAAAAAGSSLTALRTPGADEWIFRYVGFAWAAGDLPYRDAYENKPPGIFLVWLLVWMGAEGNPVLGRLLGLTAACTAAALLSLAGARLWGSRRGLLAGPLFLVAICSPQVDYPFADTETFGVLCVSGAALLALRHSLTEPRVAGIGLLCGLALLFKPVFLIETAAVLALVASTQQDIRSRWRCTFILSVCAVLPFALALLYFGMRGAAPAFVEVVFGGLRTTVMAPAHHLRNSVETGTAGLPAPAVLFSALALAAVNVRAAASSSTAVCVIAAWAVLDLALVAAQGAYYGHQLKPVLVPLALLSPGLLTHLDRRKADDPQALQPFYGFVAALLLLGFGSSVATSLQNPAQALLRRLVRGGMVPPTRPRAEPVAAPSPSDRPDSYPSPEIAVRTLTRPGDRIWCYPRSEVYVEARRRSAARHFGPNFLWFPEPRAETLARLRSGSARLVLIHWPTLATWKRGPFLEALEATLSTHYRPRGETQGWTLYLWRGAVASEGRIRFDTLSGRPPLPGVGSIAFEVASAPRD